MDVNLQQIVLLQLLKKKLHIHRKQLETCTPTVQDVGIAFQYENIVLIKRHLAEIKDIPVIQTYQKSWSNVYTFDKMCIYNRQKHTC